MLTRQEKISNATLGAIKYAILSVILVVTVWQLQVHFDKQLRSDINGVAVASCVAGRQTLIKYNDTLDDQILNMEDALNINQARGDVARVNANLKSIARLQNNKIEVPTVKDCQNPILK